MTTTRSCGWISWISWICSNFLETLNLWFFEPTYFLNYILAWATWDLLTCSLMVQNEFSQCVEPCQSLIFSWITKRKRPDRPVPVIAWCVGLEPNLATELRALWVMVKMLRCNKQVKGSAIHCAFEAHAHLAFQQRLSIAVFRQAETSGDKPCFAPVQVQFGHAGAQAWEMLMLMASWCHRTAVARPEARQKRPWRKMQRWRQGRAAQ